MTAGWESTATRLSPSETATMLPRLGASGPTTGFHLSTLCGITPTTASRVTHSALGVGWSVSQLRDHMHDADPEGGKRIAAGLVESAWNLTLHFEDESTSDKPLGCACFTPCVFTNQELVVGLHLDIHAAWIDPEHRGRGYGGHLAGNLARYLDRHGPWAPRARGDARPTTTVTVTVPKSLPATWAEHLKRYFKSGRRTRWNAQKTTLLEV